MFGETLDIGIGASPPPPPLLLLPLLALLDRSQKLAGSRQSTFNKYGLLMIAIKVEVKDSVYLLCKTFAIFNSEEMFSQRLG